MNIPEDIFNTLTDEQKKMVEAAKSSEELLSLAKEAGYELSHEQLEAISGGSWCFAVSSPPVCVEVCTQDFVCPNACIVVH